MILFRLGRAALFIGAEVVNSMLSSYYKFLLKEQFVVHWSVQTLSASIRFPGLGADSKKVGKMDYSVMVPMSAGESW